MIPSLVASDLRTSIVEYLATTFALSDDETYERLTGFLNDPADGIFRGPYLRVRLPFVEADEDAELGVSWTPPDFRPYAHQVAAWQRLAGRKAKPKPTLITTGTGSGKSEGFLVPILDHCIAARESKQPGIKALILYPMNALVLDQERRIAQMLSDPAAVAAGVRGGVWIGDDKSTAARREMTKTHLISDPGALRENPPDILLTNYKMLDRLLTRGDRQRLWAANTPPSATGSWEQPLTYLVLDEFHTYDGAQGTDVAMLLRRLGHRLGIATADSPLVGVTPVGTSATLGSSPTATGDMRAFAEKVFGVEFEEASVVGEQRRTVSEVCPDVDLGMQTPAPADVAAIDVDGPPDEVLDALAIAFTGVAFDDTQAVGDRLLRHPLTATLLDVAAHRPRSWSDAVANIAQVTEPWKRAVGTDPASVGAALERFVALVSQARGRTATGGLRPLFSVEVQIWIREVTRLLRSIEPQANFRWADSPVDPESSTLELPSVHCTSCGRSGWMAVANRAGGQGDAAIERLIHDDPAGVYSTSVRDRDRTRTLIRAQPAEEDVLWLDCETGQVYGSDHARSRIPVLVGGMTGEDRTETGRDEAAKKQRCPSCGTNDAIRFLGSRVTTLASVGITQMFGSSKVADDERRLLAFTDSVQDASHRAAFFAGRTHRFNLRATMSRALQQRSRVPLPEIAEIALARADAEQKPAGALFSLIPPDLLWVADLGAAWQKPGTPQATTARAALAKRFSFDAVLEAGLRSRFGRTLETTNTAVPDVVISDGEWAQLLPFAKEAIQANTGTMIAEDADIRTWIEGLLARLRLRGGIYHPFLDVYVKEHANRWRIWGGGDPLAPKFPRGISAPAFYSSAASEDFDAIAGAQSWVAQWTKKVLHVDGQGADRAVRDALDELATIGVLEKRETSKGVVWGIPPARIEFVDASPDAAGEWPATEVRCDLCATRHHVPPHHFDRWLNRQCLRLRCSGRYAASNVLPTNYYRALYRQGLIRRVVAAEHTGLLTRAQRELIETGFKDGGGPSAPNVLAATPTLEMGIDIGDLSAVMLTAVPPTQANYVQRVGRAGRKTGNAFVTTFAEGDPRSLYFLGDPELMIAGEITAPNCYLDAIEILRRQYLAFMIDRAAEGPDGPLPEAGEMPQWISQVAGKGMQAGGWLNVILEAGREPARVAEFVKLFGSHLEPEVALRLAQWAGADMVPHVERVMDRWRDQIKTLGQQRHRLREREKALKDKKTLTDEEQDMMGRVIAELRYLARRIMQANREPTLNALEALGLMPNYTLFDDSVTLEVSLWGPNENYDPEDQKSRRFVTEGGEYVRPASRAIRELAPGNYFYVDAHRVRIDAVDNGTENEPAHSVWRLCPSCDWATSDAAAKHDQCPRCGSDGVRDQGALLNVLPLRVVSSTERETTARVGDEKDDRDREFHEVRTQVDIDTEDISAAWRHANSSIVFGLETARAATIRYLNLGLAPGRQPRPVRLGGYENQVALFSVCRHCGGVMGIRGDAADSSDEAHHRSWCKVRSGARKEQWESLALVHQFVTEAVRILLPIAEFEHVERVASFKAALMLGLRDSFGGDPSHLRVLESDFPAQGGEPGARTRFVVLHDTVPGGTGYLTRLGKPEVLHSILLRARELIATCECQTRGKTGCHKCLYGGIERHELPRVSRTVALELLDEILAGWKLESVPEGTITGINLQPVLQSELERMFKVLLQRWQGDGGVHVTARPDPDHAARVRFDVRFQDGPHWEIREQYNLAHHHTVPDFYATRVDTPGSADVAIYLDGWEHHGAVPENVDGDAVKRNSLRGSGIAVWVLTYSDVKQALEAAVGGGTVGSATPLGALARNQASRGITQQLGEAHPLAGVLRLGAFEQLMARLRSPESGEWAAVATALALTPLGNVTVVDAASDAIERAALGKTIEPVSPPSKLRGGAWETPDGLWAQTFIEVDGNQVSTVVSLPTELTPDRARWTDWLHLGNIVAALDGATVCTTRSYLPDTTAGSPAKSSATTPTAPPGSDDLQARLDDILDPVAKDLASAAAAAGHPAFVVGEEPGWDDGTVIEVGWPESKIGILPAGADEPASTDGWTVRRSTDWTIDALVQALDPGTA